MHFEWDEAKNRVNIQKHGIDFNDAVDIFNHPLLALPDEREGYGEERWIALGWIAAGCGGLYGTKGQCDSHHQCPKSNPKRGTTL